VQVVDWPTTSVAGAQFAVVVLVAGETVMVVVLRKAGPILLKSPPYEACIPALPAPAVVTVTLQELVLGPLAESVQNAGTVTVAVPPEFRKVTKPAGEYPVTVAVHETDVPTCTVDGEQPMARLL